jgi:hypothetical protein
VDAALTRRRLLRLAGAAGAASLGGTLAFRSPAQATPVFQTFAEMDGTTFRSRAQQFRTQGYQIISLSLYGDVADHRYAASWIQRSGPAYVGIQGVAGPAAYQALVDQWVGQGYVPILVSATGPVDTAVFAAVFVQSGAGPSTWKARHGMSTTDFTNENALAQSSNLYPTSIGCYGAATDPRFIATWQTNTSGVTWSVFSGQSASDAQNTFNTQTQNGLRLSFTTLSYYQLYASVYTNDSLVGSWIARSNMSQTDFTTEFNNDTQQSNSTMYPICVQGGGRTGFSRFAAIFAENDVSVLPSS